MNEKTQRKTPGVVPFGKHLKAVLEEHGIQRKALVSVISESHLSEIMKGGKKLSREKLENIARFINVPVADLIGPTDYEDFRADERLLLYCPNQDCESAISVNVTDEYTGCCRKEFRDFGRFPGTDHHGPITHCPRCGTGLITNPLPICSKCGRRASHVSQECCMGCGVSLAPVFKGVRTVTAYLAAEGTDSDQPGHNFSGGELVYDCSSSKDGLTISFSYRDTDEQKCYWTSRSAFERCTAPAADPCDLT